MAAAGGTTPAAQRGGGGPGSASTAAEGKEAAGWGGQAASQLPAPRGPTVQPPTPGGQTPARMERLQSTGLLAVEGTGQGGLGGAEGGRERGLRMTPEGRGRVPLRVRDLCLRVPMWPQLQASLGPV